MLKWCWRQQMWMEFMTVIQERMQMLHCSTMSHIEMLHWRTSQSWTSQPLLCAKKIIFLVRKTQTVLTSCLCPFSNVYVFTRSSAYWWRDWFSTVRHWALNYIFMHMSCCLHPSFWHCFDGAVVVFNLNKPGNISRALSGEQIGTLIDDTGLNLTTSWIPKSRLPISTEDLWITMHFRVTFFLSSQPWRLHHSRVHVTILDLCVYHQSMRNFRNLSLPHCKLEIIQFQLWSRPVQKGVSSESKHKHYFLKAWFWFTCRSFVGLKCSGLLGGLMIHHCNYCRCSTLLDAQNL